MKKLIVLIALVAFIGIQAAPVTAASSSYAVEEVKKESKSEAKKSKTATSSECESKSTKCCDAKKECSEDKKSSEKK